MKSLYQYKFNPAQRQLLEQVLIKAIKEENYRNKNGTNIYTRGSGWLTAKRRIEYKISQDTLHICAWKVVAPIVPMLEMGSSDLNNAFGAALNPGMKSAINKIVTKVNSICNLAPGLICQTVNNSFLEHII